MSRINLLPWREARRKEQLNKFLVSMVIVAIMGATVWGVWHLYETKLIERQNGRIARIDLEIERVNKKIKEIKNLEKEKSRLLSRMRAIEQLQGNRPLVVRLFDELIMALPEGVTITNFEQKGSQIKLEGLAQSNARVSSFMRNIDKSQWIQGSDLQVIKEDKKSAVTKEGVTINSFQLTFSQVVPQSENEDEES